MGRWIPGPEMPAPARLGFTVSRLDGGVLLVAGGRIDVERRTAECLILDTRKMAWRTAPPMNIPRADHSATMLADGRVLVIGGTPTASAEIYDPAKGRWSLVAPPSTPRAVHSAVRFIDGRILVAGGAHAEKLKGDLLSVLASAVTPAVSVEIYDPARNQWSSGAALAEPRYGHATALLADGRVMVSGGWSGDERTNINVSSVELFDPLSRTWSFAPPMPTARALHSASLLSDGTVLIVGGVVPGVRGTMCCRSPDGEGTVGCPYYAPTDDVLVFDSRSESWSSGTRNDTTIAGHTVSALPDGSVLIAGGTADVLRPKAELTHALEYQPLRTRSWCFTGSLRVPRYNHSATVLEDGRVVIMGGIAGNPYEELMALFDKRPVKPTLSVEIFERAIGP